MGPSLMSYSPLRERNKEVPLGSCGESYKRDANLVQKEGNFFQRKKFGAKA